MIRYLISVFVIFLTVAAAAAVFFPDYWVHRYDDLI